jgi:hypothetical protein
LACIGGEHDHDRRADDLKLLFRAYAAEVVSDGIVDDEKVVQCILLLCLVHCCFFVAMNIEPNAR